TNPVDLVPDALRERIEDTSAWVYKDINNGVYRAGFAGTQAAYTEAVEDVFAALDRADRKLAEHRYLCGSHLTEADIRLFPTLIRFDAVYFGHFKCNRRRIADYPNLGPYLRDLYQTPGFAQTCNVLFYKLGYMGRSERLNPSRIIPGGPALDLDAPHDRERLGVRSLGMPRS
ncbi:MAG: glutathione S-transferase C-terminal domain-containing protein, partial [Myxococcota bacterium]